MLDAERQKRRALEAQLHERKDTQQASKERPLLKPGRTGRWPWSKPKKHSTLEDIDEEGTQEGNASDDGSDVGTAARKSSVPIVRRRELVSPEWDAATWRSFLGTVKVAAVVFALFALAWVLVLALVLRPARSTSLAQAPAVLEGTVQAQQFSVSAALKTSGSLHYVALPSSDYRALSSPVLARDVALVRFDVEQQSGLAQVRR